MVAAFARASDAVRAALAAQQGLTGEAWPDGAALRVRMAVHTGEAALRGGVFYEGPVGGAWALLLAFVEGLFCWANATSRRPGIPWSSKAVASPGPSPTPTPRGSSANASPASPPPPPATTPPPKPTSSWPQRKADGLPHQFEKWETRRFYARCSPSGPAPATGTAPGGSCTRRSKGSPVRAGHAEMAGCADGARTGRHIADCGACGAATVQKRNSVEVETAR